MATIESKTQFAKRMGVNRSTVTRWDKAGRLVLAENGRVMVEQSLAAIKATQGAREDVAQRHAQNRGHALNTQQQTQQDTQQHATNGATTDATIDTAYGDGVGEIPSAAKGAGADRAAYQSIAIEMKTNQLKLTEALKRQIRLDKADYYADVEMVALNMKSAIERLIDNLAPQISKITDPAERNQILQTEINAILEVL